MRRLEWLLTLLAGGYIGAFTLFFYSEPLYNSAADPTDRLIRWQILERAVGPTDPEFPNLFADLAKRLADPTHFGQRLPILFLAALILTWGNLIGAIFLRGVGQLSQGIDGWLARHATGMGLLALLVQVLGLLGGLSRLSLGAALLGTVATWGLVRFAKPQFSGTPAPLPPAVPLSLSSRLLLLGGMLPFAGLSLLAACLPTTDFDALAYHLLGPKEYFTAGRITFLPHNIYTTFPFFTEMFALLGMAVANDWFLGGLVGQVVLWSFGPFTALAVGRLAGRSFGPVAGWLAATAYMTTPWVYRLSVIPYVEGAMLFYGVLALDHATRRGSHAAFLAGCFSGCAVACKYPGLVMVAVPAVAAMLSIDPKRFPSRMLRFGIGMLVFAGPWLVRNYAWTGNPVYPLAYPLFGGIDLNDAQAARFANAHAPSDYRLASLLRYLFEIVARSDWQSGLIFAFAPLAMLHRERRRALAYWGLVVYLFLAFWALTHRLDRFWMTLEPILAILAGAGMAWSRNWLQRTMVGGALLLTMIYNLAYCSTALCGLPNYTIDLREQRAWNSTRLWPAVAMANDPQLIARDETVLFVGFAGIYDALVAARYNTVFDDNLLERWAHNEAGQRKAAEEIRQKLQQEGIDAIVVDWSWIERYRSPGNYGYADAITRDFFESLTRERVLTKVYPQVDHGPVELYRVVDGESD